MLYDKIKKIIDSMVSDIIAGREECQEIISFNLIRDQNVPITIKAKLLYPLKQIKIVLFCPFLLSEPEIEYEEIYQKDIEEDEFRLMKLIAKFTTTLERLKMWVTDECSDMIRWGEGVIFDKGGRAKKIPFPANNTKNAKNKKGKKSSNKY